MNRRFFNMIVVMPFFISQISYAFDHPIPSTDLMSNEELKKFLIKREQELLEELNKLRNNQPAANNETEEYSSLCEKIESEKKRAEKLRAMRAEESKFVALLEARALEAKKRAEEARREADEEKKRAEEALKRALEERKLAEEAKKEAKEAINKARSAAEKALRCTPAKDKKPIILNPVEGAVHSAQTVISTLEKNNILLDVKTLDRCSKLILDLPCTAKKVSNIINQWKLSGLMCDSENNNVKINFLVQFGLEQVPLFEKNFENLKKFLTPQIKAQKSQLSIETSTTDDSSFSHSSHNDEPIKRYKIRPSSNFDNIDNKDKKEELSKKPKKPKNSNKSKKAGKQDKKPNASTLKNSTEREVILKEVSRESNERLVNFALNEVKSNYNLSGALPTGIPRENAFPEKTLEINPKPKEAQNVQAHELVELLGLANKYLGSVVTIPDDNELFFAAYGPVLIICDTFYRYMDFELKQKNIIMISNNISEESMLLFKNLRDEKLKILSMYYQETDIIKAFVTFSRNLHKELNFAIPKLEKYVSDQEQTQSFSGHWDNVCNNFAHLFADKAYVDIEDLSTARDNLLALYKTKALAGKKDTWEVIGILAMAAAFCDPSIFVTIPGSLLNRARLLRNFLAHPEGNKTQFEKGLFNQRKKIRQAFSNEVKNNL